MSSHLDPSGLLAQAAQPAIERIRRDREGTPPRIDTLLAYLEETLFQPTLNVGTWKRACGVRDNTVMVSFHQWIGQTPREYIELLRCETAIRLLCETDLKVWKIAHILGFSSLGVFSKAFLRRVGERPKVYRQNRCQRNEANAFDTRTLGNALAGTLPREKANELLLAILNVYPDLEDELKNDEGMSLTVH